MDSHLSPDIIIRKAVKYLASGAAPWEVFLSGFTIDGLDEIINMCEIQKNIVTNDFLAERFPPGQLVTFWQKRPIYLTVRTSTTFVNTSESIYEMRAIKARVQEIRQREDGTWWVVVISRFLEGKPWVSPDILTKDDEPMEASSVYDEIRQENTLFLVDELHRISRGVNSFGQPVYLPEDYHMIWEQLAAKLIMEPDIQKAHDAHDLFQIAEDEY
jgi:hypothetical protein